MSFMELENRASRYLTQTEVPGIPPTAPTDKIATYFRFLSKGNKMTSPEKLASKVDVMAKKYRGMVETAKKIPNPDLRREEMDQTRLEFINEVETLKRTVIQGWHALLAKERQRYNSRRNSSDQTTLLQDNLTLQRAQINSQFLSEDEIRHKIVEAKNSGTYSEDEMRIYGTKSKEFRRAVTELFAEIPPEVKSVVIVSKNEIEAILSSGVGRVPFQADGAEAWDILNVLELLNDPDAKVPPNPANNDFQARAEVVRKDKARIAAAQEKKDREEVVRLKGELATELAELKRLKADIEKPAKKTKEVPNE